MQHENAEKNNILGEILKTCEDTMLQIMAYYIPPERKNPCESENIKKILINLRVFFTPMYNEEQVAIPTLI